MLVEALVAKLAVEAFHEAILLRLAWRDVVPFDAVLLGPFDDRVASELGAVVGHDHRRLAVLGDEAVVRGATWTARCRTTAAHRRDDSQPGRLLLLEQIRRIAPRTRARA